MTNLDSIFKSRDITLLTKVCIVTGGLVTKSCLTLSSTWTVAHQALLSWGFSRQEYWSGLSVPPPEHLPDPGIKPRSLYCRQILLPTELPGKLSSQSHGFSNSHVWMWELNHKQGWVMKDWCFCIVVLEKTFESLAVFHSKKIKPVNPNGNQSWIFIGRTDAEAETPVLWPPDVKS